MIYKGIMNKMRPPFKVLDSQKESNNMINGEFNSQKFDSVYNKIQKLFIEYLKKSTMHGCRYLVRKRSNFIEKLYWCATLILCCIGTALLATNLWNRYQMIPTAFIIYDTHFPMVYVPFPSVAICPNNRVKKYTAISYLERYLNRSLSKCELMSANRLLLALSTMTEPEHNRPIEKLDQSEHFYYEVDKINLTELIVAVFPNISDLMSECRWQAKVFECKDLFALQQIEGGYCYAFNSYTDENRRKRCTMEDVSDNYFPGRSIRTSCEMRRQTASESMGGLDVRLKKMNESEFLEWNQTDNVYFQMTKVHVQVTYEYPSIGDGINIVTSPGTRTSIQLLPYLTGTRMNVKDWPIEKRGCLFPDEMDMPFTQWYTERSCRIRCRLKYLKDKCRCHFFYLSQLGYPSITTPSPGIPGFDNIRSMETINCSECSPACYETELDMEIDYTRYVRHLNVTNHGHVDVTYLLGSGTLYHRVNTFAFDQLLVSLGNIATLFLGFSLLSVVEFLYWIVKIMVVLLQPKSNAIRSNNG